MKNRNLWFISFYLLLAIFIIYQLVYLILLYQNCELKALYINGFDVVVSTNAFNYSNYASIFYVPLIGLIISSVGFIGCILHSRIFVNKLPHLKFIFLVGTFIIFTAGFLISFVGELFYLEWNNNIAIIHPKNTGVSNTFTANHFYQNWIASSALIWSIFGLFIGLIVGCVILIIKLNLINVQMFNYQSQHEKEEYFEPELRHPLPSSNEFDPNESQTITIFLDNKNNKRIILKTADEYDDNYETTKINTKKIKTKKQK